MHMRKIFQLSWEEGVVFDFWSIVHSNTGAIMAMIVPLVVGGAFLSYFIALVLMVVWELYEAIVGIEEHIENRISDIVFGTLGYSIAYNFIPRDGLRHFVFLAIFIIIACVLGFFGWKAYHSRRQKAVEQ